MEKINSIISTKKGDILYSGFAGPNTDIDPGDSVSTTSARNTIISRLDSAGNYLGSAIFEGSGTIYSI